MSISIDSANRLQQDNEANFALTCPHCQAFSHVSAVSTPRFEELIAHKPAYVGLVYRCDSCNAPIFLKYPVKAYGDDRVELGTNFTELERAREKFNFTYLPEDCEVLFREALTCYTNGTFGAFASMCRRTAQAIFHDLGESGRLMLFDMLADVRQMVELDIDTFTLLKKVLFGNDGDGYPPLPDVDAETAGILVEIMKDLLYQCYVRKGKLQQAMMVRRFFVEEEPGAADRVAPFVKASG